MISREICQFCKFGPDVAGTKLCEKLAKPKLAKVISQGIGLFSSAWGMDWTEWAVGRPALLLTVDFLRRSEITVANRRHGCTFSFDGIFDGTYFFTKEKIY